MKTAEDIKREIATRLMTTYLKDRSWFNDGFRGDPDYALMNHDSSTYKMGKKITTEKVNEFCDYAEQIYERFPKRGTMQRKPPSE